MKLLITILASTLICILSYLILQKIVISRKLIYRIDKYINTVDTKKTKRDKQAFDFKKFIKKMKAKSRARNIRKAKYFKKFNNQLGDAMVVTANSLKAGHSFMQAINTLVTEMSDPIRGEFEKVIKEVSLGESLEKSLENLLERIPSKDLELMVTAILIQRETGGNLAEILEIIAETIRERIKIKGEINTLTAQGKLSAIIVSGLPIGLAMVMYVMAPDYISLLFQETIGIVMIVMGIISELIGIWMISKIIKIEV